MKINKIKLLHTHNHINIVIGRRGEYGVTAFDFDLSDFVDTFGAGRAELVFTPPYAPEAFPVGLQRDGDVFRWIVGSTDTQKEGKCNAVLRWYVNDGLAKSTNIECVVCPSIDNVVGDAPEEVKDWLDIAQDTLAHAERVIDDVPVMVGTSVTGYFSEHKEELKGKRGERGLPGLVVPTNGTYSMLIDSGGDLCVLFDDADNPPSLFIDDNGDLCWGERS